MSKDLIPDDFMFVLALRERCTVFRVAARKRGAARCFSKTVFLKSRLD
jgi:hypothetical protein